MSKDETVISEFPWKSSRTANVHCRVSVRVGKEGTRNVYIEPYYPDADRKGPGVYFRPAELAHLLNALAKAQKALDG